MNFLKLIPALLFYSLFYSPAYANYDKQTTQGEGRVHVNGSIIDSACSIDVDSREQSIDMGTIPLSVIRQSGQGLDKNVTINLINCMVKEHKHFQITFDGDAEGDLFGVRGDVSGVGLQISDSAGVISPGKAMSLHGDFYGNSTLNYTLRLMANSHALKAGSYSSSIRFRLDYF
ncbi:fimbrial protein [Serratia marcescens]|uniref:fimbrial protein n=1 Tax=Serratia marcescens TaxID=615 RepID=UPI0039899FDD